MKTIIADFGSDHAWQADAFFGNGTGWGASVEGAPERVASVGVSVSAADYDLPPDPVFLARAKAAYGAIARADGPTARWIYQSWALRESDGGMSPPRAGLAEALSRLHGFSSAAPEGNFILLDMSHNAGTKKYTADGSDGGGMWRDPWKGKQPYLKLSTEFQQLIELHGSFRKLGDPLHLDCLAGESSLQPTTVSCCCCCSGKRISKRIALSASTAVGGQDYGGDQGIKGNMSEINTIPFDAPPFATVPAGHNPKTQAIGVGYTPEGLDQNPVRRCDLLVVWTTPLVCHPVGVPPCRSCPADSLVDAFDHCVLAGVLRATTGGGIQGCA